MDAGTQGSLAFPPESRKFDPLVRGRMNPDPRTIVLPREDSVRREIRAKRIATFLAGLDPRRPWEVIVRPFKRTRSNQQNRYERGVACLLLSQAVGYEPEEVHEYLCGTY